MPLQFTATALVGCYIIDMTPIEDSRGWFSRVFCKQEFAQAGIDIDPVQINHSFNTQVGTLRGMHYQLPPFSEGKLIRCIAGAVQDIAVDIRAESATFLQYVAVELSATNRKMIYIPPGFAHGFITLQANTELLYHHSQYYTPGVEAGINHADHYLNIKWTKEIEVISERDKKLPMLAPSFKGITI